GAGFGTGLLGGRGRKRVELQRADVGPTPLLVAPAGPGERPEPRERLATPLDQPRRLVAPLEGAMEGVLGEAAGGGHEGGPRCITHGDRSHQAEPGLDSLST